MITKEAIEAGARAGDVPDYKAEQIITAAFAAMPGPAVKKLEWREAPGQMAHTSEPFPYFKYVIVDDDRGVDWSIGGDGWNPVENVEAAKAAAQADYEARILSALTPTPDLASENERLRKALEMVAHVAGNIPDDILCRATGANDARYRGGLVCSARDIAKAALERT